MLIDPGLESSRDPRLIHCSQPSLQVSTGCLDGVSVIQSAGTAVVVTVRSSMKALMGGCLTPDLLRGPLHSVSAALTSINNLSF